MKDVEVTRKKSICTFSGSSFGRKEEYVKEAGELGRLIGENGLSLVYGGGSLGLMGAVARNARESGAEVIGILPEAMNKDYVVEGNVETTLLVVRDMHERKKLMYEKSDAFIALPGGIGTLEELFEIFTWKQLGYHVKPVVLLNVKNYFDHIILFLKHSVEEGFLTKEVFSSLHVAENAKDALGMALSEEDETLPEKI